MKEKKKERNAFIKMTISCYLESKDLSCQCAMGQSVSQHPRLLYKNYLFLDIVVFILGKKEGEPGALISFRFATRYYYFISKNRVKYCRNEFEIPTLSKSKGGSPDGENSTL